jgi:hypothetical protein
VIIILVKMLVVVMLVACFVKLAIDVQDGPPPTGGAA